MPNRHKGYGHLAAVLVALIWSTNTSLVKLLPWSAFSINFARCVIGTLVLSLFSKGQKIKADRISLWGAGLFALSMALAFLGAKRTTAASASFLVFTYPVFVILFGFLVKHKKPSPSELALVCMFTVGILICCSGSAANRMGNLYSLLSGAAYSGVLFLSASHQERQKDMLILGFILIGICCFPFVIRETVFDWKTLCLLLYLGVVSNGLAYILQEYAIARISVVTYSFITITSPVFSALWAFLLCDEKFSPHTWLGGTLILLAALMESLPGKANASQAVSK